MLCVFVRRRRCLPLAAVAGTSVAVACFLFLLRTISGRSFGRHAAAVTVAYPPFFDTYVNYTGPYPVPAALVDPDAFTFRLNEPDACSEGRSPGMRVLLYVHSAPSHFQQRQFIRRTWASRDFYPQFKMATVFFLGLTDNERMQRSIERESLRHRDVVQAELDDTYYRLTYKSVSALTWIRRHCGAAEFVVKTDDDVFVNAFRLVEILKRNDTGDTIHCSVYGNASPHRHPNSKWFVNPEEYPWSRYPDFCAGMALFYAGRLVPALLDVVADVPYLKLDDVFVTGMVRRRAGIRLRDLGRDVNIFAGNACMQSGLRPELFCQVDGEKRKWALWIQLLMTQMVATAKNDKSKKMEYVAKFHEILSRDFEGFG